MFKSNIVSKIRNLKIMKWLPQDHIWAERTSVEVLIRINFGKVGQGRQQIQREVPVGIMAYRGVILG